MGERVKYRGGERDGEEREGEGEWGGGGGGGEKG